MASEDYRELGAPSELGGGARFWVYKSPEGQTSEQITHYKVVFSQGDWYGVLHSAEPEAILQTPGLSGEFEVKAFAVGPGGPSYDHPPLTPLPDSDANIGCNESCAAMVGLVAADEGQHYWTVSDAVCDGSSS
jgi:hypothetical protein